MANNTQTSAVSTPTRISVEPTRWDLHSRKSPRSRQMKANGMCIPYQPRAGRGRVTHPSARVAPAPGVEMTAQRAGTPVASVQVMPPDLYAIRRKSSLRQC
jgi:hypothetical protein